MIALTFTGIIAEDARLYEGSDGRPSLAFTVKVRQPRKAADGTNTTEFTFIRCTKTGASKADRFFLKGQKVWIRGGINVEHHAASPDDLLCPVWQFELL